MANKELQNTSNVIQNFIIEGRKLFFKEKQPIFVEIRFNHNDVDGTRKWRVIFNGKEFHTAEIFIEIPCKTESKFYEDLGGYKHHFVCNANIIYFENNICRIK
jgi:hypothetical protein